MKKKDTPEQRFYDFALSAADKISPLFYGIESLRCGWKVSCCDVSGIARVLKGKQIILVSRKFPRLSQTTKVFILLNLFFQAGKADVFKSDILALEIMRKNKFKIDRLRFLQEIGTVVLPIQKSKERIKNISLNSMIGNSK